jgi:hypothetical protein
MSEDGTIISDAPVVVLGSVNVDLLVEVAELQRRRNGGKA